MAIYNQFTLGTANNQVIFNKLGVDPYFRVTRRFPTRWDLKQFDIDLPEGPGIADFDTQIGKSYMVIEGKMYPRSETAFHAGREQLRSVCSLTVEQDDALSDHGYVPLTWNENVTKTLPVKPLYVDMAESTQTGITQPFRILCKIKYPVIHSEQFSSGVIAPGGVTSSIGGFQIPFTVPLQVGSATIGSGVLPFILPAVLGGTNAGQGSLTLTNTGDHYTYPTITITGPISRPRITNVTTGEYIELDVNLTSTGDSAIISYDQTNINVTALNANAYGKLTSGSSLFKVKSGENVFTLSGASVGSGARASISFQSAYSLS